MATQTDAPSESFVERRAWLDRLIQYLQGVSSQPTYSLVRWIFLRMLGFIYFFAFASLWVQIIGLIGSHGLSPLPDFLQAVQQNLGGAAYTRLPTIFWLNSSDAFLTFVCGAGTVLAVLVIFDVLTLPALLLLWVGYLSLFYAGQDFLSFQWDVLLLEVGFLAVFLAPWHILPRLSRASQPSRIVIWLLRLLLFRLMLESGLVKLASGDPTWRDLTATTYHYWTQPLPTVLAWYTNQLPLVFHQLEVLVTFFVELVVPFFIFGPRRVRFAAAVMIALHQTLIWLTGNYTFFNFLTIALCFTLVDDQFIRALLPRRATEFVAKTTDVASLPPAYRQGVVGTLAALILFLNVIQFTAQFLPLGLPVSVTELADIFRPLHLVNGYGLFAVMTTQRPEIIVEGSNDGQTWLPYEFKYKVGDLTRAPVWVEPYQPRLDWQMWFAALGGNANSEGWFPTFMQRLLQGTPEVLALLDKDPFPDTPPSYVRAELYQYHFTTWGEYQATGNWWTREQTCEFMGQVSLADFK